MSLFLLWIDIKMIQIKMKWILSWIVNQLKRNATTHSLRLNLWKNIFRFDINHSSGKQKQKYYTLPCQPPSTWSCVMGKSYDDFIKMLAIKTSTKIYGNIYMYYWILFLLSISIRNLNTYFNFYQNFWF